MEHTLDRMSGNLLASPIPDCHLVILNKGQIENGAPAGFWVCEKCGHAGSENASGTHRKPYLQKAVRGARRPGWNCDGEHQKVFLGQFFTTDLLLLRIEAKPPLITDLNNHLNLRIVEDALYSAAEAVKLAASRHRELDVDPSEFGSGFRIVPRAPGQPLRLDLYIYDTLSGGAGYSEVASEFLEEILQSAIRLMEDCPSGCETSCQDCLRHFFNQHLEGRLDRNLGADILRYATLGEIPMGGSRDDHRRFVRPLRRLLELDGLKTEVDASVMGHETPLLTVGDNDFISALFVYSGLVDIKGVDHPAHDLVNSLSHQPVFERDYVLKRDLASTHRKLSTSVGG